MSRDGLVSPLDALMIINHLNSAGAGEAEGESVVELSAPATLLWNVEAPLTDARPGANDAVPLTPFLEETPPNLLTGLPPTDSRETRLWDDDIRWTDEDLEELLTQRADNIVDP